MNMSRPVRHCLTAFLILLALPAHLKAEDSKPKEKLTRAETALGEKSVRESLAKLDAELAKAAEYQKQKEKRIADMKKLKPNSSALEHTYWYYSQLYDEYFVFDADSALDIAKRNIQISRKMNDVQKVNEWRMKQSFVLSATGLLKESEDVLDSIDVSVLPRAQKVKYYNHRIYLLSHQMQYAGQISETDRYRPLYDAATDSINKYVREGDEQYLWLRLSKAYGTPEVKVLEQELQKTLISRKMDCRDDAINAYALCRVYKSMDDKAGYINWLVQASIADIRCSNRDIAALEELAKILYRGREYTRAYEYLKYCQKQCIHYKNRVRLFSSSAILEDLVNQLQNDIDQKQTYIYVMVAALTVLVVILLLSIVVIMRDKRRLARSNSEISHQHMLLKQSSQELKQTNEDLEEAGRRQAELNEQLRQSVELLNESNYIKEEYIGYVFTLCLDYIGRFEDFRRDVNRKVRANLFNEVRQITERSSTGGQSDIKTFYRDFDTIFLKIYPDFVRDFNTLMREDEQIIPKDTELLNTELRIYALCRLGITDSIKIAKFLRCSVQTIYNNRLRTRSRSVLDKDEFEQRIRTLGRISHKK